MMEEIARIHRMLNRPEAWDLTGAGALYAGVDVGTYKIIVIVVDGKGAPRAAAMRRAEVVRSGLIVDYIGALSIVQELMGEIHKCSSVAVEKGATSYPPQTESGNIHTTRYILEGAGLEVVEVLDEPTAANLVLGMKDGAIVDVGGGTTGIAVFKEGDVVYSNDEPTGGVHVSLVLSGGLKVSHEEAERIKADRTRSREILPMVRPVIDKISSIIESHLKPFDAVKDVCLVGGTCELAGFTEVVRENLGLAVFTPAHPQLITPYGIALSCLHSKEK